MAETSGTNTKGSGPDAGKFVKLLTANYYRINAFILSMVPNAADAEDMMQETSEIMWQKFDEFEEGTDFAAWGVTIAKFRILNFRKSKQNQTAQLSEEALRLIESETDSMSEELDARLDALRACLSRLDEKDRQFIKLRYSPGATARSVAEVIGTSVHRVYRSVARINSMLLRCIRRRLTTEGVV
ncbi:RNA polymerase sigma factor [Anaerohalosphaera lusitana]|uniref:RNA polymerase sigma factor n=1 Tax=Anaerohalosphaera lusitana TaxID=1936003 RepID=A0A1U9NP16_9BACT|nr:sigma-70 family RNA polymerase sigma factor [Anaerohalosphaera lusitana]AQT69256.1 RNA polymerase sigma factor [Anaerohalosphaera lusitana]